MTAGCETSGTGLVFLLDVDNTLLDNDQLKEDLASELRQALPPDESARFWQIYEEVRAERDVVDIPETFARWRSETNDPAHADRVQAFLDGIQFKRYLYPHVLETIAYLRTLGTAVILSDGDDVFQPRKIRESGLLDAVGGHVLIYVHKEDHLQDVFAAYPAAHYVIVDDKPRILAAVERDCPATFTSIMVLQGKYAVQGEYTPPPDYTIQAIGDLRSFTRDQFAGSSTEVAGQSA